MRPCKEKTIMSSHRSHYLDSYTIPYPSGHQKPRCYSENVKVVASCFLWSCFSDICLHTSNATVQTLLASNHPGRKCQWKGGCQMYHHLILWWCLSLLCYFSMGSGEHHHFGSSEYLCSFRCGRHLEHGDWQRCLSCLGWPWLRVDSSPVCLLISSRKIGTPRKKGGKSDDSCANSSSSAEEGRMRHCHCQRGLPASNEW